jgi:malto-oligosyltrehalose trehalohydrolase
VHAIIDDSSPDILEELAAAVRDGPGRDRHIHLVLENDHNAARYLARDEQGRPRHYVAQWNDDIHHSLHLLLTGEGDGYYMDYGDDPIRHLGRCLAEGFAYQGERSRFRHGAVRGEPSGGLPSTAFVSFLQNHDQVGNRAFGERLSTLVEAASLRAALAILLLAPSPPLLFMGDEFASPAPFLFFCDLDADLAAAVTEGRRREFARFSRFADPGLQRTIPDPNDPATFRRCKLAWGDLPKPAHQAWFEFYRRLLRLRRERIIPRLRGMRGGGEFRQLGENGLGLQWRLGDGCRLSLLANLGESPLSVAHALAPAGTMLYRHPPEAQSWSPDRPLPPWSVIWFLDEASP